MDARRYDEAIAQYRKTLELDPNFSTTHYFLGRAYEAKGMYDEAVNEYSESARTGLLGTEAIAKIKEIYPKSGWKAYVKANIAYLEAMLGKQKIPAFAMAAFYAKVDEKEKALDLLERAYAERDFRMIMIGVSFEFDSLRSEQRFIDLEKRLGLPQ